MDDFWSQIATDIAIIIAPVSFYIEYKVKQESKVIIARFKELEAQVFKRVGQIADKTDERFDINETDATRDITRLEAEMSNMKERFNDMLKRMDSWENYVRRAKGLDPLRNDRQDD